MQGLDVKGFDNTLGDKLKVSGWNENYECAEVQNGSNYEKHIKVPPRKNRNAKQTLDGLFGFDKVAWTGDNGFVQKKL